MRFWAGNAQMCVFDRTALGKLTAFPDPLAGLKGLLLTEGEPTCNGMGRGGEEGRKWPCPTRGKSIEIISDITKVRRRFGSKVGKYSRRCITNSCAHTIEAHSTVFTIMRVIRVNERRTIASRRVFAIMPIALSDQSAPNHSSSIGVFQRHACAFRQW